MSHALLIAGHGSRDPEGIADTQRVFVFSHASRDFFAPWRLGVLALNYVMLLTLGWVTGTGA